MEVIFDFKKWLEYLELEKCFELPFYKKKKGEDLMSSPFFFWKCEKIISSINISTFHSISLSVNNCSNAI